MANRVETNHRTNQIFVWANEIIDKMRVVLKIDAYTSKPDQTANFAHIQGLAWLVMHLHHHKVRFFHASMSRWFQFLAMVMVYRWNKNRYISNKITVKWNLLFQRMRMHRNDCKCTQHETFSKWLSNWIILHAVYWLWFHIHISPCVELTNKCSNVMRSIIVSV